MQGQGMQGQGAQQRAQAREARNASYGDPSDEISLRDLYLVFRNNLWIILLATALVGAATFLILRTQPPVYEGESTTLVTPQPVQIQSAQNLNFRPSNDVSYEAYRTLAQSRPVIDATLAQVPQAGIGLREFAGETEMLIGPRTPEASAPLSVIHRVRHTDPEVAALLANAWAERTLVAVQTSLLASLGPISERTADEVDRLRDELDRAEAAYRDFQVADQARALETLILATAQQLAALQRDEGQLTRLLAADRAAAEWLLEQAAAGAGGTGSAAQDLASALAVAAASRSQDQASTVAEQVAALQEALERIQTSLDPRPLQATPFVPGAVPERPPEQAEALSGERLALLSAQLGSLPEGSSADLGTLLTQVELHSRLSRAAATAAEVQQLGAQRASLQARLDDIQRTLAGLEYQRSRLTRERDNARRAFDSVAGLQPVIDYVTQITPANARVLNEATVPEAPVGPRVLLGTAVALLLTVVLATLFVFLREAVRAPPPARA